LGIGGASFNLGFIAQIKVGKIAGATCHLGEDNPRQALDGSTVKTKVGNVDVLGAKGEVNVSLFAPVANAL
jgi:hypothetical protein